MFQITRKKFRSVSQFILFLGIIVFLTILTHSCNTRSRGCLDTAALNFDLDAERSCDDCCQYPDISITLSQRWNDSNFILSDLRYDVFNNPYRILDLKYMLSSFSWKDGAGELYTIDSNVIACGSSLLPYTPDLIMIEPQRFEYRIDSIRLFPIIDTFQFFSGCIDRFACVDTSSENIPFILGPESPLWNPYANQREDIRIIIQKDTHVQVMDTLYISSCDLHKLNYIYDFELGQNQKIDISVNYAKWFAQVDINNLSTFNSSLMSGIPGSFTRTP